MDNGVENLDNVSDVQESRSPVTFTEEQNAEIDRIIRGKIAKVTEKFEREKSQIQSQSRLPGGVGGVSAEDMRRAVREEMQSMRQEYETKAQQAVLQANTQKVVETFVSKMELGREKYSDFQQSLDRLALDELAPLIPTIAELDNAHDVIKELADNYGKVGSLLALSGTPKTMKKAIYDLSSSIKANESAKANANYQKPLSQIKPTTTAVDNGIPSVRDLMKQEWMRR